MTKTLLSALALVLASCSKTEAPTAADDRAAQALQALSARDEERVARCNESAEACTQNVRSEAGADACAKLSEHCGSLQDRLEEVRTPAVGCWRAVQECAAHTPEQAQCRRDPAECETAELDVDAKRDPVVACSERVEACLARVGELPEAAAVSCENVAAACERAATKGKDGQDAGSDDDDDLENDDDDDGQGGGNNPRGGPHDKDRADAGVSED